MKYLVISLVVLLIVGGVTGYFAFVSKQNNSSDLSSQSLHEVSDAIMVAPNISDSGESVWYGNNDGEIFRFDLTTKNRTQYPSSKFLQKPLMDILWPETGGDFIAQGRTPTGLVYSYFNSQAKLFTPLSFNIRALDWMPDGKRIAVIWKNADNTGQLVISDADGTGYKKIASLPWSDLAVKVSPDGTRALVYREFSTDPVNKIYLFNLDDGSYSSPVIEGTSVGAEWVSNEEFVYLQRTDQSGHPALFHYSLVGQLATDLKLRTTLERLAIDYKKGLLYAAVDLDTRDDIKEIDLKTLRTTVYYSLPANTKAKEVIAAYGKVFIIKTEDYLLYQIQ